ncbi:MAG: NAD(P)/FAD-dependent oxidoreductase [Hyphomonadaceae bacterium]
MAFTSSAITRKQNIAVIGSGIAGMSAAWLLSHRHDVTMFEKGDRLGGHSNTVTVETSLGPTPVDTGFIVFNEATYPNLIALFHHLAVATRPSDMSFGVSLRNGRTEYSSVDASAFLAGGRNLASPRFWAMALDLLRFYRQAPDDLAVADAEGMSLGEYLMRGGYGAAFQNDHLLPQAAAIWSASVGDVRDYPARAFVRFFENHGLLKLKGRPAWRTVEGGSQSYVAKLTEPFADRARLNATVVSVRRDGAGVTIRTKDGRSDRFDAVVIAAHADSALAMLEDPTARECDLLGAFRYTKNRAVLHTDAALMPRRRQGWASWNYVGDSPQAGCIVTYWMNKLQRIESREQLLLTLNPRTPPKEGSVLYEKEYEHPLFDGAALRAQRALWSLQGVNNTWYCGAHFGAGFHEDGLQAGLAVAEQLGGVRRPWSVADESGRISLGPPPKAAALAA